MKRINWNTEKSRLLKESRGVCGAVLADYMHPNQQKYSGQRIMVICFDNYAYLIPYVENEKELFLKTIIPSRRATEKYLGEDYESNAGKRRKRDS